MQGISDAFQGVGAPLTLVLMVDVLTSTIFLGLRAFGGPVLIALGLLVVAVIIMVLWTFCSVCYDFCKPKQCRTKVKRVLVDIVIGIGGILYLIGDNLPPILRLQNDICEQVVSLIPGVQLGNATCVQQLTNVTIAQLGAYINSVPTDDLVYNVSLTTYGKVLIGISIFLFSIFPTCVFKCNSREEMEEISDEKEINFPVTYTLTSLAVIVEINAWFTTIVSNPSEVCTEEEMIANFVLYGLFVIGWFVVIVVFLISDCRKTDDERKKKKSIKCYVIFSIIVLIPSLPLYLLAGNERPLSCVPNLRCITNNDSGCDAVQRVRFGMLIVLGFFLTLLAAFTVCCKLHLMFLRKNKARE